MSLKSANLNTVTADTVTDLFSTGSGNTSVILSLVITNHHTAAVNVDMYVTNSSNTIQATLLDSSGSAIAAGQTITCDSKIVVESTDKLRVQSDHGNTSFYATYSERTA